MRTLHLPLDLHVALRTRARPVELVRRVGPKTVEGKWVAGYYRSHAIRRDWLNMVAPTYDTVKPNLEAIQHSLQRKHDRFRNNPRKRRSAST